MPDRILRVGILTSEGVNRLGWPAEVFYRRLMSVVDDFGRYDGRPAVVRAALYALKVDRVSEPDIGKWIRECEEAALVRRYTVDAKPYLELLKFDQKVRAVKSKWPDPPAIVGNCQQASAVVPVVVDVDVDGSTRKRATPPPDSFEVTEPMASWAVEAGLSKDQVIPQTERFLDHFRGQGKAMKDWDATWRNWIRKAVEYRSR
jgi:hypothetical protein